MSADSLDLDKIAARADAATEGPWDYNGYAAILSTPKILTEDEWWSEERLNDGHSYDHRVGQTCEACGPRFTEPLGPSGNQYQIWDCARAGEALDQEALVCGVPASYGDTATGQRVKDAEFIAHAREDVPALVAALRVARHQLDAVRALHPRRNVPARLNSRDDELVDMCAACRELWPCRTIAALSSVPDPQEQS